MRYSDLTSNNRTLVNWIKFAAAGSLIAALTACGGGGGGGTTAAAPPPGGGGGTTPPATAAAAITAAAAVATNDTATAPTAAFGVVDAAGVPVVSINSPPKVNFTVISDGAVMKTLTPGNNARFIIAQLVKGTNGAPDQWKSYTARTRTEAGVDYVQHYVVQDADGAYSTAANLVYNEAGYYTFTFPVDIKDATKLPPGVTYDPTLTHRVAIQLTYTNAAGESVRTNPYFDFTIDANGNAVAVTDSSKTRKVVDVSSCNQCHEKLAIHGGGRVDTQFCVLCHNPNTTDELTGNVVDLKIMAHKIHAGEHLKVLFDEDYTVQTGSFAEVKFPQDLRNCTKCHDNTKAPQADNWKNVPSRAACGACHAGIDFATGAGATIANAIADVDAANPVGTTKSGHIGGAKSDDAQCALCHNADNIPAYHATEYATTHNPVAKYAKSHYPLVQGDLPQFEYKISEVTINASKQAVVKFQVLIDGTAVSLNDPASATEPLTGYTSGARMYTVYATGQDGIAAPSDWNTAVYANFKDVWKGSFGNSMTLTDAATKTYTAVLVGKSGTVSMALPADAKLVTAMITRVFTNSTTLKASPAIPAMMAASGNGPDGTANVARRVIFSEDKCNTCHERLGSNPNFHDGNYSTAICAACHTPNQGGSGGWSASFRVWVHGIHGAEKRTVPFTWQADFNYQALGYPGVLKNCETCHLAGTYDFSASQYTASVTDNMLNVVAARGTTFAASADVPKNADGTLAYGLVSTADYGAAGAATNLVSSPIAAACTACHDSDAAISHVRTTGNGSFYRPRSEAILSTSKEQCLFCHGAGKLVPIADAHAK